MTSRRAITGRPPRADRDARLAARRDALLDAATAAIEADGADATMTRMAAEAGVTKAVLYRHFGDRTGLYEAIARRFATDLRTDLHAAITEAEPGRTRIRAGIDAYFAHIERHPGTYRFLTQRVPVHNSRGAHLVTGFIHRVGDDIARLLDDQDATQGHPPGRGTILGHGITGMVQQAGHAWLDSTAIPRHEAVGHLTDILWDGLSGPQT